MQVTKLTADGILSRIMTCAMRAQDERCGFEIPLGNYPVRYALSEDGGWEITDNATGTLLDENRAQTERLVSALDGVEARFDDRIAAQERGPQSRVEHHEVFAVLTLSKDFVSLHSGADFMALLRAEWSEQTNALAEAAAKHLRRHELRTARMFAERAGVPITLRLESGRLESDIWSLPLSRFGLMPLMWDSEVCGMARLLAERLRDLLGGAEIMVEREEAAWRCRLTLPPGSVNRDAL